MDWEDIRIIAGVLVLVLVLFVFIGRLDLWKPPDRPKMTGGAGPDHPGASEIDDLKKKVTDTKLSSNAGRAKLTDLLGRIVPGETLRIALSSPGNYSDIYIKAGKKVAIVYPAYYKGKRGLFVWEPKINSLLKALNECGYPQAYGAMRYLCNSHHRTCDQPVLISDGKQIDWDVVE